VGELRQRMGSEEFSAWQVIFPRDQLSPHSLQVRHAQLLAAIYTGQAKPPPGKRGFTPGDFMAPDPWAPAPAKRKLTAREIAESVRSINAQRKRR
jgi:hypothetical protein